ncbi:MAG: M23 family metallopeptidase [Alphaproteobacteria bacterium]|nr:M23 family metallopeptidase [Alphaproteobacteria bacterium]
MNSKYLFSIFSFFLISTNANSLELCGKVNQGEFLIGKAGSDKQVYLNDEQLITSPEGFFLLAFGRDEGNTQNIKIVENLGGENSYKFEVAPTSWDVQNIKGVPPRKVTPSDSDLEAIELERKVVRTALKDISTTAFWRSGFVRPVEGRVSGKFGGQRIMNNIPKNPHQGMDIAAKEGTPVKSTADGKVVLAYPDLFYSGNVIIIDHGFGLQTIYAHLKDMNVKRGDIVKQGDVIGSVGKTGRVTGPHLHWGASLRNVRFNPQSLLDMENNHKKCLKL